MQAGAQLVRRVVGAVARSKRGLRSAQRHGVRSATRIAGHLEPRRSPGIFDQGDLQPGPPRALPAKQPLLLAGQLDPLLPRQGALGPAEHEEAGQTLRGLDDAALAASGAARRTTAGSARVPRKRCQRKAQRLQGRHRVLAARLHRPRAGAATAQPAVLDTDLDVIREGAVAAHTSLEPASVGRQAQPLDPSEQRFAPAAPRDAVSGPAGEVAVQQQVVGGNRGWLRWQGGPGHAAGTPVVRRGEENLTVCPTASARSTILPVRAPTD